MKRCTCLVLGLCLTLILVSPTACGKKRSAQPKLPEAAAPAGGEAETPPAPTPAPTMAPPGSEAQPAPAREGKPMPASDTKPALGSESKSMAGGEIKPVPGSESKLDATPRANLAEYNLGFGGVALQGYSPVSYVEQGQVEKGLVTHVVRYRGVTYYLTSDEQVARFMVNPDKYEPAYGGWCAYSAAEGRKVAADPTSFKIVNGRLLLFLKNEKTDAKQLWDAGNETDEMGKADAFWQSRVGK